MVCDFEELYRYLIDDFVIQYCQDLKKKDFTVKTESLTKRKIGKRQSIGSLIDEEAFRFAQFVREDKKDWTPRIVVVNFKKTDDSV